MMKKIRLPFQAPKKSNSLKNIKIYYNSSLFTLYPPLIQPLNLFHLIYMNMFSHTKHTSPIKITNRIIKQENKKTFDVFVTSYS